MPQTSLRVLLFVSLVIVGLLGNYFKYPIFLNIDFLFGSIFSMLALQFLGFRAGVLAAVLIGSYTFVLWNHPYAVLIITAEALMVGLLVRRYAIGMVLADALYWILLGMPLTVFCYGGLMGVAPENLMLVVTKQTINGIANTLVARLIYTAYALRTQSRTVAYRDLTYNLLAFFALWPALFLMVLASRSDFRETDQTMRQALQTDSARLGSQLDDWVAQRTVALTTLAGMAATRSAQQMQVPLEQARASDPNFLRTGLFDAGATTIAYAPQADEAGASNLGKNFADRSYFPVLRASLQPMLSDLVISRIGPAEPVVTLVAPVLAKGQFNGYVSGVLSLEQIRNYLEKSVENEGTFYTLLDKQGNTILTNRKQQKTMEPLNRGPGTLERLDERTLQWVPTLRAGTPIMERWKSSLYVAEVPLARTDWKLVLEQPVAPFQKALNIRYTNALGLLLAILLASLVLAEVLSRKTIKSLEELTALTHELPAKLASEGESIAWPQTAIVETNRLVANFKGMANSLSAQFASVQQMNASLELRVDQRTAALNASVYDKEALLKEVHHRVKNNLQVITSLLRLEARRSLQPDTKTVLADMQGRIRSMALLHESLYRSGTFASVDLGDYLRQLARQTFAAQTTGANRIELQLAMGSVQVGMDQAIPCGLLVNELISNGFKHAFPEARPGAIRVALQATANAGAWCLEVSDNGVGLPADFDARRVTALGLQLATDLARQLGGELQMESLQGARFSVVFKAIAPAPLVMPV